MSSSIALKEELGIKQEKPVEIVNMAKVASITSNVCNEEEDDDDNLTKEEGIDTKELLEKWIKNLLEDRNFLNQRITKIKQAYDCKCNGYLSQLKDKYKLQDNEELLLNFKSENEAFIKTKLDTIELQINQGFFVKEKVLQCLGIIEKAITNNVEILFETLANRMINIRQMTCTDTPVDLIDNNNMLALRKHKMITRHTKRLAEYYSKTCLKATPASKYIKTFELAHKKKIPEDCVKILKTWLMDNVTDPYPTKKVKMDLAYKTGLSVKQVHNWFINARGRICKKYMNNEKFSKIVEKEYLNSLEKASSITIPGISDTK